MASLAKRRDGRWRARYRDAANREHARHFARKIDAQRWLDEVTASVVTGQYVDPASGRQTLREYAEAWRAIQVHRPTTQAHLETMLRLHVYPILGDRALGSIRPSDIQTLVTMLSLSLQPSTVGVVHRYLAGIMKAAVRDRRIAASPCEGTRLPKSDRRHVEPLPTEAVRELEAAVPARFRAMVTLGAGTGLRQGEAFGLSVDRVDFLRRTLTVDRQLITLAGREPYLAPPKTQASVRVIPLPQVVVDALAGHLAAFPAGEDGFVFTSVEGRPLRRQHFSARVWRPAVAACDSVPAGTRFHDLRHYYASLLIRHGESVKTVQARLGHASAAETLDTYSHLWPDSDDRTREAVDVVLGAADMSVAK
jgi:integrase